MILFKQAASLSHFLYQQQQEGKTVSFVPTMGALHNGHLSLLAQARNESDLAVCSIFVNPTQFNNPDDYSKYPVTLERDIEQLVSASSDVLFLPTNAEIYPPGYQAKNYELGVLETILEGRYRPGHFQGVCQVVDRLLEIVNPNLLYMGQKDYQQCQVVQQLLKLTNRQNLQMVTAPTIREPDGLAMSSRNLRLNNNQRAKAPAIFEALQNARAELNQQPLHIIKRNAVQALIAKGFVVDYFEIADATTLLPATVKSQQMIALVAASLDDIRLIDNLPLN
ncbi:MAG TPA: pantoate--beta-alanine ligase [Flavisolibacter sp.]|jgi:pantoate--beta-alanine ligase|nr:pantoate--beta-alanine ligase [Flavisolibacter sp.]